MIAVRWPDGKVRCPQCGSEKVTYLEKARLYRCYGAHPRQKFSLKVGTIFEDSPIAAGEVASRCVAAGELQEWNQYLRDSPRSWRHSKIRMVHAAPHSACDAEQVIRAN